MLTIQVLSNIGDMVQNINQFSSNLDSSVINSVQQFISKMNSPFFKYLPEIKTWYIGALMAGFTIPHLNFEKQQKAISELIAKHPNKSVIAVLSAGLIIWLLIL